MTDWAQLYKDNVAAVTALATDLDDDELATTVPGSPAWTVRDVIAHMAGVPMDVITGRMDGAPSPEWTARAVDERAGLQVADLVTEIRDNTDRLVEAVADSPAPAPIWDIAVHHADLHEALGKKELPPALWQPVLDGVAANMLGERPVTVRTGEVSTAAAGRSCRCRRTSCSGRCSRVARATRSRAGPGTLSTPRRSVSSAPATTTSRCRARSSGTGYRYWAANGQSNGSSRPVPASLSQRTTMP